MAKLRWGVKTAPRQTTHDAILKVWREADATPAFEHAWRFDHFSPFQGDLDGRYDRLAQARLAPKPVQQPYPPFVIGGAGEQLTLRVVARSADVWNSMPADAEELRRKVGVLREHCAAVARDPGEIELSVQTRVNYDDLAASAATLQPLVDAGATHLVLMLADPYADGIVARLADEVVARVG